MIGNVGDLRTEYGRLSAEMCRIRKLDVGPDEAMKRAETLDRIDARAREIEQDLASLGAPVWAPGEAATRQRAWRWLRVQWGREQRAADFLREGGIACYWPNYPIQVTVTKLAKNRWRRERLRPLIPGALFLLQDDACEPWSVVDRTPGITGIVRDPDGHALRVPDADIALIRRIEAKESTPAPWTSHAFKIGQQVRFTEDIHSHWPAGIVSRLYKSGRIGVDVTVLGGVRLFDVLPHQIEAM